MSFRVLLLIPCAWACSSAPPAAPAAAPKAAAPSEAAAGRVTLTAAAEQRLGIPDGLRPVELRTLGAHTLMPGDVVAVSGRTVILSAPITGIVGTQLVAPGARVNAGDVLCALVPLLGASERVAVSNVQLDADGQVARAQVADDAAALALERAEKLARQGLAGARAVDEARAARDTARESLKAAQDKQASMRAQDGRGVLAPVTLRAPWAGVVRDVRVGQNQKVLAAAPLLELVQTDPMWVRVALPPALSALETSSGAWVKPLTGADTAWVQVPAARHAPPTQSAPGMVDAYFVLTGNHGFSLGQRVAVRLGSAAESEHKTVPADAVLHGLGGETWVYEQTAPQVYERRRVEMLRTEGDQAVLGRADALLVGARVVTGGAMELFGAEFGVGK